MSSSSTSPRQPVHTVLTPRLLIRSAIPSDAPAVHALRSNPLNFPYGGLESELSPAVFESRIADWHAATLRNESAFMFIFLRNGEETIIGTSGFNVLFRKPATTGEVLVGDTGMLIDHVYQRRGYAGEALSAVIEYGFRNLGVQQIFIETKAANAPFRGLMAAMCLGGLEKLRRGDEGEECVYEFDEETWDQAKKECNR